MRRKSQPLPEIDVPLDERRAAQYVGACEGTFRWWRTQNKGPRFYRAGRLIRYKKADLDRWIEERMSAPAA